MRSIKEHCEKKIDDKNAMLEKRLARQISKVEESFNVSGFIGPSKQNVYRSYDEFVRRMCAGQENVLKRFEAQREQNGEFLRKFSAVSEKFGELQLSLLETKKDAHSELDAKVLFVEEKIKLFR